MKSATVYHSVRCDPFYHYFIDLNTAQVTIDHGLLSAVNSCASTKVLAARCSPPVAAAGAPPAAREMHLSKAAAQLIKSQCAHAPISSFPSCSVCWRNDERACLPLPESGRVPARAAGRPFRPFPTQTLPWSLTLLFIMFCWCDNIFMKKRGREIKTPSLI